MKRTSGECSRVSVLCNRSTIASTASEAALKKSEIVESTLPPAKRSNSRITKRAAVLAIRIAIRPADNDGVKSHRAVRESSSRASRAGACRNSNACAAGGVSTISISKAAV
ncbi:MAG TPA: hypothetical protein VN867_08425 [Candidatus Binataceae bacterium]|nr:hypothetical protein [Candidatus Binataceae bacterium]